MSGPDCEGPGCAAQRRCLAQPTQHGTDSAANKECTDAINKYRDYLRVRPSTSSSHSLWTQSIAMHPHIHATREGVSHVSILDSVTSCSHTLKGSAMPTWGEEVGKWVLLLLLFLSLLLLDVACIHDGSINHLCLKSEGFPLHHCHCQQLEPETVGKV